MKRWIGAGVLLVAAALTPGGAQARSAQHERLEVATSARIEPGSVGDGYRLSLWFERSLPRPIQHGSVCISVFSRRTAGSTRIITIESGCARADLHGDMDAGTASLFGRFPTTLTRFVRTRVNDGWRTVERTQRRARAEIDLWWRGGEPRYEPGVGWACAVGFVGYRCYMAPYPRVSKTYDALVSGSLELAGMKTVLELAAQPGILSFHLPT